MVLVYYMNLSLEKKEGNCKTMRSQTYTIAKVKYTVNTASLVANAQQLADNIIKKAYDDWFEDDTLPS